MSCYYEKTFNSSNLRKKMFILALFWKYRKIEHKGASIIRNQTVKKKGNKISGSPQPQTSSAKFTSLKITTALANNANICERDIPIHEPMRHNSSSNHSIMFVVNNKRCRNMHKHANIRLLNAKCYFKASLHYYLNMFLVKSNFYTKA